MRNCEEYQLSYDEFKKICAANKNHFQRYLYENLISRPEAKKITNQSDSAFGQSVKIGVLRPFFYTETNSRRQNVLFLKEELEQYAQRKRMINLPTEKISTEDLTDD